MKILYSLNLVRIQDILFDDVDFQRRYRKKLVVLGDEYSVAFCTTNGIDNTRKCDTEGFLPVASLYGVVGSPSLIIRYMTVRTGKI